MTPLDEPACYHGDMEDDPTTGLPFVLAGTDDNLGRPTRRLSARRTIIAVTAVFPAAILLALWSPPWLQITAALVIALLAGSAILSWTETLSDTFWSWISR